MPCPITSIPANHPDVRYTGRVDHTDPAAPVLYWAGNEVAIAFQGTALSVHLICKTCGEEQYLKVIVDEGIPRTIAVSSDNENPTGYTIASGLPQGHHTARVIRNNDWDTVHGLVVCGFTITSGPAAVDALPPRPSRRIEFYGDSITSGFGILDPGDLENMANADNHLAYGAVISRMLSADYTCISRSGIGIVRSCDPGSMPEIYNLINPFNSSHHWDFESWTPDVVVINLGQNDYWLIAVPDRATMESAYRSFFASIRSRYPAALIVATLGCMDTAQASSPFPGYLSRAVAAMHDPKIILHILPDLSGVIHPYEARADAVASELAPVIATAMGWSDKCPDPLSFPRSRPLGRADASSGEIGQGNRPAALECRA